MSEGELAQTANIDSLQYSIIPDRKLSFFGISIMKTCIDLK